MKSDSIYWDKIALKLNNRFYTPEIFKHYWISHLNLLKKWYPLKNQVLLKTDMFEEFQYKKYFSKLQK